MRGTIRRPVLHVNKFLYGKEFNPGKMILVETINGKPALESDYSQPLKEFGFAMCYKGFELVK